MSINRSVFKLKDCCLKIGSGATPKGGKSAYLDEGDFRLIRSQNVHNNSFSYDGLAFISATQAMELKSVEVKKDDVLLNITGDSVARSCKVREDVLPARVNQHVMIIRADGIKLHPDFLRYWLVCPSTQEFLLNLAQGGATRNALTKGMIEELEVPAMPINQQLQVTKFLNSISDEIDNLQAQNTTLEALAQTLFRSWFVNFDPVHAKAAGQTPGGMSPELAALFPSEFVVSELGMIPKGWKISKFSQLAQRAKKSVNPGKSPDVIFTHFSIPAFDSKGIPVQELGSKIMSNKTLIETPAVLQSKLNPHKPRIWRISKPKANYVCSTEFLAWNALNPGEIHFVDSLLRSDRFTEKTLELVSGTSNSHQRAKPGDIESIYLPLPQRELRENYSLLVSALNDSIDTNTATTRVLAELRDELLPRLISGKLCTEEAEEAVSEVLSSTAEEEEAA